MTEGHKSGFISVVGRPNVGKSTLINTILKINLFFFTTKPKTTRHRILGIYTQLNFQAIFVDTPGLHRKANKMMNKMMNKTATNALMEADLNLFLCEAKSWTEEDQDVLDRIKKSTVPTIMLLNKIDQVHPKEILLEKLAEISARHNFHEVIPVTARRRDSLKILIDLIPHYLPLSPQLYSGKTITDRGPAFTASETIREKLILELRQEIPYGLTVEIENFEETKKKYSYTGHNLGRKGDSKRNCCRKEWLSFKESGYCSKDGFKRASA
jgi:GTP-binding protein Era